MTPQDAIATDRGSVHFNFDNSYAQLPKSFYARVDPTPVASPRLVKLNAELAIRLRLDPDALASVHGVAILAGAQVAEGSEPLAIAYAGHQFGNFVPLLGDGRANLLGEVIGTDGVRYDLQLKGSGPTPFSRRGDGRAALGPVLREYILSEAMAALGVRTTRALAAVTTGEDVMRESSTPGAILTRVATSHLRIGTFQYFAARADMEGLRRLSEYAIVRHYPEAAESGRPVRALLDGVVARQATLVAQWMLLGFIHGVMNTDNTSISGETIDYGPCAFMEAYDPATVFSSIDRQGRYAYGNQPNAAHWNLARLAEALLPLLEVEEGSQERALDSAHSALAAFGPKFETSQHTGFRRKLGLMEAHDGDEALVKDLLQYLHANSVDFTSFFRKLCAAAEEAPEDNDRLLLPNSEVYAAWAARWRLRQSKERFAASDRAAAMRLVNPAFIPRNHIVEEALQVAVTRHDFKPFEALLEVTSKPYEDQCGFERYALPADAKQSIRQTFCGT